MASSMPTSTHATLAWIPIEQITAMMQSRTLREPGVARLVESLQRNGFLLQYPVAVTVLKDGYRLLAGHHRVAAAKRLEIERVPALLYTDLTQDEEWRVAVETNRAHESVTLPTFVDDAELVWKLLGTGRTQEEVGTIMGWKRTTVAQYAQLQKLSAEAWQVVVTSFQDVCNTPKDELVTEVVTIVTTSPFTEGILRDIVLLTPWQPVGGWEVTP